MKKKRAMTDRATIVPMKAVQKHRVEIRASALVDGTKWYTIQVEPRVVPWIRNQDPTTWYYHTTHHNFRVLDTFDVDEKLYTMLALRWA